MSWRVGLAIADALAVAGVEPAASYVVGRREFPAFPFLGWQQTFLRAVNFKTFAANVSHHPATHTQ